MFPHKRLQQFSLHLCVHGQVFSEVEVCMYSAMFGEVQVCMDICCLYVTCLPHCIYEEQERWSFLAVLGCGECRLGTAIGKGMAGLQPLTLNQRFKPETQFLS